ncbi:MULTISPECIES: ABC transporter ATP-binding protein [unclassified Paenibacillus]|uniref:ABC transporter ATP-binding protein n=1 Tax=unclassified Paenibacillus TaxID=185978 RepID=UPI0009A7EDD1|nr:MULTISPECIES: ABC transporter ATP-binding protein [unclassified Paenibacillus]SLK20998.1 peptide/nickel transport system ATP-binding protein [Paenibacillus sp. RU5A]SOC76419.1 peptide/nickel transport system ATP-binding protein [Paenibacillus sp. RU26A]SOC77909.1 peptide/nickel transport system ATP-binding protein [Paenibacillus sp. RU5M]
MSLLQINGLRLVAGEQTLIHDMDLSINDGEWMTVIGESGSGKTLTSLSIGRLLPNGVRHTAGQILFNGQSLSELPEKQLNRLRGKEIAYVFQDYTGVFSPFLPIGKQLDETLRVHYTWGRQERKERIAEALNDVSLPAKRVVDSYPFQLSGGQLQRVSIATAMLLEPKLLIADEPTSALDWVTGTEILDLLIRLKEKTGFSILFITHDLKLARRYADQIAIMREGRILESGNAEDVLTQAIHPYTQKLLAAESMLSYAQPDVVPKRGRLS